MTPTAKSAKEATIETMSAKVLFNLSTRLLYTKFMKKLKYLVLTIFYLTLVIALFCLRLYEDIGRLGYLLLAAIMPLLPYCASYIVKLKFNDYMIVAYDIFIMAAMIGGNIFGFYSFTYFDQILHFTSGILIAFFIYLIYAYLKGDPSIKDKRSLFIATTYVLGLNAFIAFLWECFEFALLVFFGNDAINNASEGVYDTMTDMIVCFLGGLIIIASIIFYYKTKRKNFLFKAAESFIEDNRLIK